jgi:hypothetical protein
MVDDAIIYGLRATTPPRTRRPLPPDCGSVVARMGLEPTQIEHATAPQPTSNSQAQLVLASHVLTETSVSHAQAESRTPASVTHELPPVRKVNANMPPSAASAFPSGWAAKSLM